MSCPKTRLVIEFAVLVIVCSRERDNYCAMYHRQKSVVNVQRVLGKSLLAPKFVQTILGLDDDVIARTMGRHQHFNNRKPVGVVFAFC